MKLHCRKVLSQGSTFSRCDFGGPELNEDDQVVEITVEIPFIPYRGLTLVFGDNTLCLGYVTYNIDTQEFSAPVGGESGYYTRQTMEQRIASHESRGWRRLTNENRV